MTSTKAKPLCARPALRIGTSCALSPEKLRATKVAPSVSASRQPSIALHRVGLALLAERPGIGRGRELPLGQAVDAVVLEHVEHVDVAADRVAQLPEADRQRVAVAGDADVDEVAVGGVGAGDERGHAAVHAVEAVRLAQEVRRRLRRAADPRQLRHLVRRIDSSQNAWMIAAVIESWPQPAQSVVIAPS